MHIQKYLFCLFFFFFWETCNVADGETVAPFLILNFSARCQMRLEIEERIEGWNTTSWYE